ncbi:MAG: glycine/betaine ABC transporter substrate-binding protein [Candidatus Mcinerneyibacterium aminivorans]|uniref:Glycine/betaine ABC transporter substrate-binding protein n=1 Tax=Candidatus Mcinerneyibacterium aminivorans TaxID=2703815 RepID=A0A5D0MJC1_9BACT|nr:MAG: glycine/betaine ABC transporter substrate-binding protein [Candidatus Mcinerneyibacterium aminivorans]
MRLRNILIFALIIGVLSLGLVGCSQKPKAKKSINFGYVQWPGVTVKTHLVKKLADYMGYDTKMIAGTQQVVMKGMETKDIDVFPGVWLPSMKTNLKPYQDKGVIELVKPNLKDCLYITAVNKEAWEAGVKTFEDLKKHAAKFDKKIYGIEPGNDGNKIVKNKIIPEYNLNGWELVPSSTGGMLSSVKSRLQKGKWVAFNAWKPHYMNVMFDIKYLEDPKNVWPDGGKSTVYTAIRNGYSKEDPNFYKFLQNFELKVETQNRLIYEYKKGGEDEEGRNPEEVVEEWIANNLDTVEKWVKDVKALNGEEAIKAISENAKK